MRQQRGRRPATVLLIEDDPGDQELTRRALRDDAVCLDLRIVSDGEKALDYLHQRGAYDSDTAPVPDLILLDLNLPRIDGWQVLKHVREEAGLRHIPVVILTTSRHDEDIVRSYHLGCNSYITKPVQLAAFLNVVHELGRYWFDLVALPQEASR